MIQRITILLIVAIYCRTANADTRVHLTISVDASAPIDAAQSWTQRLGKMNFANVRIENSKELSATLTKSEKGQRYDITGFIDRKNQLQVPGGRFRINQQSQLKAWYARVVSGEMTKKTPNGTFGLSNRQLVLLFDRLAKPVAIETKGKRTEDVVLSIRDAVRIRIGVTPKAKDQLEANITEEFKGVSSGTALAAILRPNGLVLVPQLEGKTISLAIVDVRESQESWPVGWPPEKPIRELAPRLFDRLNAQIADTTLKNVLDAVQQKLEVPFLYDQNSLARNDIQLDKKIVKYPARTTFYKKVIDHVLTNQLMEAEVRVDEAGKPFLWISTSK